MNASEGHLCYTSVEWKELNGFYIKYSSINVTYNENITNHFVIKMLNWVNYSKEKYVYYWAIINMQITLMWVLICILDTQKQDIILIMLTRFIYLLLLFY